MKNSKDIIAAINNYCDSKGISQREFAKELLVAHSTVIRWVNGTSEKIRQPHWAILEPKIREELEKLKPASLNLSVDETLLLKSYREFSSAEKETALEEFAVKAAYKKAHKAG